MFTHICLHFDDVISPWEPTNQADFVAQRFFYSRLQYESLEGLMDFLAILVHKLRQNKQNLIRGIPSDSLGDYYKISGLLTITLAPKMPGSRTRALKTQITAQNPTKFWATISADCPGDDVIKGKPKNSITYPNSDHIHRKPQTHISKVFFPMQTTRLHESLNSS